MVKIILDCFGGDHSPEANVEGGLLALERFTDLQLILTGDESAIRHCLEGKDYDAARLEIVHAPQVIGCDERPTDAIRLKRDSSMMKGIMKDTNIDSLETMMKKAMENGVKIIACSMSMDVMGIREEELIDGVEIGGVGTYLGEAEEANVNLFI